MCHNFWQHHQPVFTATCDYQRNENAMFSILLSSINLTPFLWTINTQEIPKWFWSGKTETEMRREN